jgi:hypothetical protein
MMSSSPQEEKIGSWLSDISHFGLVYAAYLVGFVASFLTVGVLLLLHSDQGFISKVIDGPVPLAAIIAGFWIGRLCNRWLPSRTALFSWIPPAVFLTWNAWVWQKSMSIYDSTWDTYFGSNCGGSECLYQLFLTVPFYTALAYSAGALTTRKTRRPAAS